MARGCVESYLPLFFGLVCSWREGVKLPTCLESTRKCVHSSAVIVQQQMKYAV